MNVLVVAIGPPHPARGGGANRTYHLMRALLSAGDAVTLVCILPAGQEAYLDRAPDVAAEVRLVSYDSTPLRDPWSHSGIERVDRWMQLLTQAPYRYTETFAAPLSREVGALLATGHFDCLVAETGAVAYALAPVVRTASVPSVADFFDIDSIMLERSLRLENLSRRPWDLAKSKVPLWKLRSAEQVIARSYTRCAVTSLHDARVLEHTTRPSHEPIVVSNGVDTDYFSPLDAAPVEPELLVFTGYMAHAPNIDGARYFCREILPIIRAQHAAARLCIVGADPVPEIRDLDEGEDGAVRVLGAVPDTRPFLAQAAVAVVPLRFGSGTRLKVLEALAMQKPTVSTSLGIEGLDTVHERHLLVADGPEAFASSVLRLLNSPGQGRELGVSGRALVECCYQWQSIGASWRKRLLDLVARTSPASRHSGPGSKQTDAPDPGRA